MDKVFAQSNFDYVIHFAAVGAPSHSPLPAPTRPAPPRPARPSPCSPVWGAGALRFGVTALAAAVRSVCGGVDKAAPDVLLEHNGQYGHPPRDDEEARGQQPHLLEHMCRALSYLPALPLNHQPPKSLQGPLHPDSCRGVHAVPVAFHCGGAAGEPSKGICLAERPPPAGGRRRTGTPTSCQSRRRPLPTRSTHTARRSSPPR